MRLLEKEKLSYEFTLEGNEAIKDLFSMTPYFYRTGRESVERLNRLEKLTTLAEFDIFVFGKEK
jgi:23S rRNA (guanine745-N1)-methyltransferase